MSKSDIVMSRMKNNYENRAKTYLTRRTPVIIRLDGRAFHTYTKGLERPFDEGLIQDMQETTKFLCENIQGAKCGYTQSDEISILVTDYKKLTSEAWFDYGVQKITSISASLCTAKFNRERDIRFMCNKDDLFKDHLLPLTMAFFDSRAFNIPKEEVSNYFLARQRDAVKNSISMLAQSLYSHSELFKKSGDMMQEMCFQKGHNWNDLGFEKKRGSFIVKNIYVNNSLPEYVNKNTEGDNSKFKLGDVNLINGVPFVFEDNGDVYDWLQIPDPTIRTKWEVIETPNFNEEVFKTLI